MSVSDGELSSAISPAFIQFDKKPETVASNADAVNQAIIGALVSGGIGLLFLAARLIISYQMAKRLQAKLRIG